MRKRGISLIVLIVTIIVIIILAAVVILTLSKNNPIESAKEAAFKEDIRTFQDELAMYIAKDYTSSGGQRDGKISATSLKDIQKYIQSFSKKYEGKFIIQNDGLMYQEDSLTKDEKDWIASTDVKGIVNKVPQEWRTYIADVTEDGVPIPKGFTYKEGTKETGVVIEDGIHNEFVWIPSTESEYVKDFSFPSDYNASSSNTAEENFLSNLDETLDVKKYGGFYIGRYEATTPDGTATTKTNSIAIPTCQKEKTVWTDVSQINAKASAESMFAGDTLSVQSGLLTGKAWDRVCHWIENYITTINENSTLRDSRYYGNYYDSQSPANTGTYVKGQKQLSGANDNWRTKNIYDLAGNAYEWTYESNNYNCVGRGASCYNYNGKLIPVSYRSTRYSYTVDNYIGFRVRLYIKTN